MTPVGPGSSAGLSELHRRVLAAVDDAATVHLAMDLARIPSFTTEETPCAAWLAQYLAGVAGREVTLREVELGRK